MELGIPATRRAPAPGGVDTDQVFEEGRDTRVDTHRPGESRDAAVRQKRVSTRRRASSTCATLAQPAQSQLRSCWTVSVTSSDFRPRLSVRLKLYYCNNKLIFRNDMADSSEIAQRT